MSVVRVILPVMTATGWRAMGQEAEPTGTLYEGVPPWLREAVYEWLRREGQWGGSGIVAQVRAFDQLRRAQVPVADVLKIEGWGGVENYWEPSNDLLPFVDYMVWQCWERRTPRDAQRRCDWLEEQLLRSGSSWTIGTRDGFPGLERRMPLGIQEAADHTMVTAGDAGQRLSEAWHAAFGVNPDPWKAYSKAVLAVEDAALPVVSPKDKDRTLGKAIAAIRDQGWTLPTPKPDERTPTSEVLRHMLGMLWYGHGERHGGAVDPGAGISQEDAEVAVLLAVPLVQWFTSGAAARP